MLPRVDIIRENEITWLLMNSPDFITNQIKQKGGWGIHEVAICRILLDGLQHPIVIDAGANIGSFSIPIAQTLTRQKGKVYCFEPQRIVFQQLCANAFVNRLDNIYTYNIALGDYEGQINVPELDFSTSTNIGAVALDEDIRSKVAQAFHDVGNPYNQMRNDASVYSVPLKKLDSFKIFKDIAFIKVDIEGAELEFFKGAAETIKKNNFPPIIFELWSTLEWYKEKAEETKKYLMSMGYNKFEKIGEETLALHPSYGIDLIFERNGNNVSIKKIKI